MPTITTTRDLYLAIAALVKADALTHRSLEDYLRALWSVADAWRTQAALSGADFLDVLTRAASADVPPFDEAWRANYAVEAGDGFAGWQAAILRQIVDLREMAEQGHLQNQYRYFGLDAPRGSPWYNFDAATFLECAVAGQFGGWEQGDDTGRLLVPGPVATLTEAGQLELKDPADLAQPIAPLRPITWADFQSFLEYGQMYE